MTKLISYDGEGNKKLYEEYVTLKVKHNGYEGISAVIKTHETYNDGKLEHRTEYEYDENGKKLKSSVYNNGGLEGYKSYHYNESGRLIKVTACDAYSRIVNYYEIEYTDEIGNGKTYVYDKDGTLIRTYDWVIFR